MILKREKKPRDVIAGMFLSAAAAMILTQLVGVIAGMIDGVITSNFLGADAYSAVSHAGPIISTVSLFAAFIASGAQVVCSQGIGRGDMERADRAFTLALLGGAIISVFFILLGWFFPDLLAAICGITEDKYPAIYDNLQAYLRGYLPSIIPLVFVQILGPLVVLSNGKKLVAGSAIALCVTDVIGDLANVFLFKGHTMGMGLATSAAYWVELGILLTHFLRGKACFHARFAHFDKKVIGAVLKYGSPTFVRKLATVLRDLFVNHFNIAVSLTACAIAARSIQNDLNSLMFALGPGIGKVLLTMAGMYYAAADRRGLTRLFSYAMAFAARLSLSLGLLLFIFAPQVVSIFTRDAEVMEYAVLSVRCMAVGLVFDTVSTALQNYLQGIQNLKMVNFMNFGERFFIPVITAAALGALWGSKGVLISVAVGKFILAALMAIVICIRCKGLPRKVSDFMFLPEGFGGRDEDNIYASVTNMDEVMTFSRSLTDFCSSHDFDSRTANRLAMYIEEMGGNIVRHGQPRNRSGLLAELRVHISDGRLCLTLRDYCQAFDPVDYWNRSVKEDPTVHPGLRLVMMTAEKVTYVNAFDSNNTIIIVGRKEEQPA